MSPSNIIYRVLTARIAPMVYVMMFVNLLIGLFFATGFFMSADSSILYGAGVLFDRQLWGVLLALTSASVLYGFIRGIKPVQQFGGIAGFTLWLFAAISLFQFGYWYVLTTTAVFHMIFHAYVYLAGSLDVLHRQTMRP